MFWHWLFSESKSDLALEDLREHVEEFSFLIASRASYVSL